MIKSNAIWTGAFVTKDATGALSTPTGSPIGTLYINGASTVAAVTITGANPYAFAVTMSASTPGDVADLYIAASISSIGTGAFIAHEMVDTKYISDISTTVAVSITTAQSVATGRLALTTHNSFAQAITSTTAHNLASASRLWLGIKQAEKDTDANAIALISASVGLTYLDRAAYTTASHGALTVTGSSGAWTITPSLDETATALLTDYAPGRYPAELKTLISGSTYILWSGKADIIDGLVQAVT